MFKGDKMLNFLRLEEVNADPRLVILSGNLTRMRGDCRDPWLVFTDLSTNDGVQIEGE